MNLLQRVGDQLLGRFVPRLNADAGTQDYTVFCACYSVLSTDQLYRRWEKSCAAGRCGPCYASAYYC